MFLAATPLMNQQIIYVSIAVVTPVQIKAAIFKAQTVSTSKRDIMNKLLIKYTKLRIAELCEVQPKTVHNWFKKNNIPHWAIEILGFTIEDIQE